MDKEMLETGLRIRTEVLGKEYVENSLKSADDFNMPFQEFVTAYCWGGGWGRPGLTRKQRSMLNLAMIPILNRPHELKLHIRGRDAGVDADLHEDLADLVLGDAVGERAADVQLQFCLLYTSQSPRD